jgi:hypothetical protein
VTRRLANALLEFLLLEFGDRQLNPQLLAGSLLMAAQVAGPHWRHEFLLFDWHLTKAVIRAIRIRAGVRCQPSPKVLILAVRGMTRYRMRSSAGSPFT